MTDLDNLPLKQPGERLSAAHINALTQAVRNAGGVGSGTYQSTRKGLPYDATAGTPPFEQQLAVIESEVSDGLYNVQLKYYDHTASEWKSNETVNTWQFDATVSTTRYKVGDLVTVWWHSQRSAFVPTTLVQQTVLKVGKADGEIAAGATDGTVKVWEAGAETSESLSDVHHDWITNDTAIADDAEVIVGWFAEEACWRVIGAECP